MFPAPRPTKKQQIKGQPQPARSIDRELRRAIEKDDARDERRGIILVFPRSGKGNQESDPVRAGLLRAIKTWFRATLSPMPPDADLQASVDAIEMAAEGTGRGELDPTALQEYVDFILPEKYVLEAMARKGTQLEGLNELSARLVKYVANPKVAWRCYPRKSPGMQQRRDQSQLVKNPILK